MKIVNRTCDICGAKLYDDTGWRNTDVKIYGFKKIGYGAFVSGKYLIEKCDICRSCLNKFEKWVEEQCGSKFILK